MRKIASAILLFFCTVLQGQVNNMVIQADKLGAPIQSTMYGIFFEDINYAADGGLYGELVKNRSFEFPQALQGWKAFGKVAVRDDGPFERNPHYVRLSYAGHDQKHTGLENEGYFGIGVKAGESYRFSVWARLPQGEKEANLRVELIDPHSMGERQAISIATFKVDHIYAFSCEETPLWIWSTFPSFLKIRGKVMRMACVRTWHKRCTIYILESSVSLEDVS